MVRSVLMDVCGKMGPDGCLWRDGPWWIYVVRWALKDVCDEIGPDGCLWSDRP